MKILKSEGSQVQDRIIVFYKSQYFSTCFSLLNIAISNTNDQRVMNFELQTNGLYKDEVFLRIKILDEHFGKMKESKFYVHDSLNHVRKDVV